MLDPDPDPDFDFDFDTDPDTDSDSDPDSDPDSDFPHLRPSADPAAPLLQLRYELENVRGTPYILLVAVPGG
ncbi:MAG: hypothetical protein ACOX52_21640 [Verrucomicrobiota bacterium]